MLGCTSDCKCLARQDRMQVQIYLRHAGSWLHRGLRQHGYYMDRVLWDAYVCAALEPQEKPLDRPSSRRSRSHRGRRLQHRIVFNMPSSSIPPTA
jgi:hypothetical protein